MGMITAGITMTLDGFVAGTNQRFDRPPNSTIPTTFTEVSEYVQVSHRQLMLGAVAVIFNRQFDYTKTNKLKRNIKR